MENFNFISICQCKHVGEMAYMTNWYNLHRKTALGLVLIIARSSNVMKFTAGKLFHLSIATFGDVSNINTVYITFIKTFLKDILNEKLISIFSL